MTEDSSFDAAGLLARARAGDDKALNALLEAVRPVLQAEHGRLVGPVLRSQVDTSDLIQQSLIEGVRDFGQFKGETRDQFVAWLKQILHNNCRDAARKQQLPVVNVPVDDLDVAGNTQTPSEAAAATERDLALQAALKSLSPDDQQVIELRHFRGLEFEEVGRMMGRSKDAVKRLFYRAMIRWENKAPKKGEK